MARHRALLERILAGTSDSGVAFGDLRNLLLRLGFEERIRGSHHLFRRAGIEELINLQRDGKHDLAPEAGLTRFGDSGLKF